MTTLSEVFRFVILPAMCAGAAVALFISLREEWRWWRSQKAWHPSMPSSAQLIREWEENQ